jgi:mevalonate kinase
LSFINENKYTDLNFAKFSNKKLRQFYQYLVKVSNTQDMAFDLDLTRLKSDIDDGLYFESSIPQGYGMGSSGAMVAALFSSYAVPTIGSKMDLDEHQLIKIRREFSILESYFHGTSSGLDPLLCYLRTPVLIEGMEHIRKVDVPRKAAQSKNAIFLVDTGMPEKTDGLVIKFHDMYETADFKRQVDDEYIPTNNKCIDHLISGRDQGFYKELARLSKFQLDHMTPMIPKGWASYWAAGLNSGEYYLKLLGSGGGGYLLGFTKHLSEVTKMFRKTGRNMIIVSG